MLFWCFNLPAYCRPQLAAARCTLITEALLLLGIYNLTLTLSTDDVLNEEGHAEEKNNNSRCWLICVSVAHCHPAPTYIKQAAGRWWHHSAALVWQIVACYRRTVLPLGYNSVLNVFSCQWFAVQCVRKEIMWLLWFTLIFFFVLYFKSDDSPSNTNTVLPFCFVFQILLSYSNLQKHPRMFAGHLFAKRVRWPWTHTDRVVIVLTTLYVFFFLFLSPSSVLTRSCLMTHPVPLICLWCDGVMVH